MNGCLNNFEAVHLWLGSLYKQQEIKSLNSLDTLAGASGDDDIQMAHIKLTQSPCLEIANKNWPM